MRVILSSGKDSKTGQRVGTEAPLVDAIELERMAYMHEVPIRGPVALTEADLTRILELPDE